MSLDHLVALNDEIAALARAGVPLDLGLKSLASDMPGRLGRVSQIIGQRLEAGESLPQILADPKAGGIPAAYAAVVAAGLRVGRLPSALEGIAHAFRRHRELQRTMALGLIYPLLVVIMAFALLSFWLQKIAPVLVATADEWDQSVRWIAPTLRVLRETSPWWANIIPLAIVAYGGWLWYRSGEALRSGGRGWFRWGIIGRVRRMRFIGQKALFTDILGVLLEHGTPLDEALQIAGRAVDDPALRQAAAQLTERIRTGEAATTPIAGLPPLLGCLLTAAGDRSPGQALRRAARTYHDDAANRARRLSTSIPLVFTLIVGGGSAALYAAVTIIPWFFLLQRIGMAAGT